MAKKKKTNPIIFSSSIISKAEFKKAIKEIDPNDELRKAGFPIVYRKHKSKMP